MKHCRNFSSSSLENLLLGIKYNDSIKILLFVGFNLKLIINIISCKRKTPLEREFMELFSGVCVCESLLSVRD